VAAPEAALSEVIGVQTPMFAPQSDWRPPTELPSWRGARRVGLDVETKDPLLTKLGPGPRRPGGALVGFSFAIEDGPGAYVPLRHGGGDNVADPEAAMRWLRDQARVFDGDIVGHNLAYDLDWLAENGVEFPRARFLDVMIAEPLVYELHQSYSLAACAARRGLPGKDETLLREAAAAHDVDAKSGLWMLPARFVGPYAEHDARLPLELIRRAERDIEEQELDRVWDLECRVLPAIVRMIRRGVRIDFDRVEQVEKWTAVREQEALDEVFRETKVRIELGDVWRPDGIAKALRACGVAVPSTPKTKKPSVTDEFLESVRHPVAEAVRRARKANKLRTTFCASLREHAVGDRVHCGFNQLRRGERGARSGRLSSDHPNLQQIPGSKNPELARMIRGVFVADRGKLWASIDYSQQEVRIAAHFALAFGCEGAEAARDLFARGGDFHQGMADITGLRRRLAKENFLATLYGMGSAKLCRRLGLPTEWTMSRRLGRMIEVAGDEGRAIINQYDANVPWARELATLAKAAASERGYVRTLLGRRVRLPKLADGSGYDWVHSALNGAVQGSAADQTKMSMVLLEEAGHGVQLSEHDENDASVENEAEARRMAEIMESAIPLRVVVKAEVATGDSWACSVEGK